MNKIWIIKSRYNFKLCKTEKELLKYLITGSKQEVLEYDLKSSCGVEDFLKMRERDRQLNSLLNEVDSFSILVNNLVRLYEKLSDDGEVFKRYDWVNKTSYEITKKQTWIDRLKKWSGHKEEIKKLLVDNKEYFFNVSNEVEWFLAILKIHNFKNSRIMKVVKEGSEWKEKDHSTPLQIAAFLEAKKQLRS